MLGIFPTTYHIPVYLHEKDLEREINYLTDYQVPRYVTELVSVIIAVLHTRIHTRLINMTVQKYLRLGAYTNNEHTYCMWKVCMQISILIFNNLSPISLI